MKRKENNLKKNNQKFSNWKIGIILMILIFTGIIIYFSIKEKPNLNDGKLILNSEEKSNKINFKNEDSQIKSNIKDQLIWNPQITFENISVSVAEGKVSLRGYVDSYLIKEEAAENALEIKGVTSIDNELVVKNPKQSVLPKDKVLKERINNLIKWNTEFEQYDIDVSVQSGKVILKGTIDKLWKKFKIEEKVYSINGVHEVSNLLSVVPTEKVSDERIARNIQDTLKRNIWINPENLDIKVTNGHVILHGKVNSYFKYEKIENIASLTLGVVGVENKISVRLN